MLSTLNLLLSEKCFCEYKELSVTAQHTCEVCTDNCHVVFYTGSFEVSVNGREIFSKLKKGGMPEFDEVW